MMEDHKNQQRAIPRDVTAKPVPRLAGSANGSDWRAYSIYTLFFLSLISAFNYLDRSILGLALPPSNTKCTYRTQSSTGLRFCLRDFLRDFRYSRRLARRSRQQTKNHCFRIRLLERDDHADGYCRQRLATRGYAPVDGRRRACCVPPAHSMISDLFRKSARPLAMAIFGTSFSIAYVVFFPIAGWIINSYGWRTMFVAAGVPASFSPLFSS